MGRQQRDGATHGFPVQKQWEVGRGRVRRLSAGLRHRGGTAAICLAIRISIGLGSASEHGTENGVNVFHHAAHDTIHGRDVSLQPARIPVTFVVKAAASKTKLVPDGRLPSEDRVGAVVKITVQKYHGALELGVCWRHPRVVEDVEPVLILQVASLRDQVWALPLAFASEKKANARSFVLVQLLWSHFRNFFVSGSLGARTEV